MNRTQASFSEDRRAGPGSSSSKSSGAGTPNLTAPLQGSPQRSSPRAPAAAAASASSTPSMSVLASQEHVSLFREREEAVRRVQQSAKPQSAKPQSELIKGLRQRIGAMEVSHQQKLSQLQRKHEVSLHVLEEQAAKKSALRSSPGKIVHAAAGPADTSDGLLNIQLRR